MPFAETTTWREARIIVTGGAGFLGRHIVDHLRARGADQARIFIPRRSRYDLTTPAGCALMLREAFEGKACDVVIHAAGAVGGLGAHRQFPGDYAMANLTMALHMIEACRLDGLHQRGGVFVQVGSMTSYPAAAPAPLREEDLWKGYPEPVSAPYAIAKLAALEVLRAYHAQHAFLSAYVIPVNLYGPGDNFDPRTSHAAAAIIRRCVEAARSGAPEIVNWGTGAPTRDFLYVADAAEGVVRAAEVMREPIPINLGSGRETSIAEFVSLAARAAGYAGAVRFDPTKPDGQARRCLDTSRARELLGWSARTALVDGLTRTVEWYKRTHIIGG